MRYKLSEAISINPKESIAKGTLAKKIPMDKLQPFCRDVPCYEIESFSGGSKFKNGDTIMARITPCLENGKTAKVSILDDNEVGFGSTEYIVFRAKEGLTDEDYVYYLICSPYVREIAIKSMVGTSGRQRVQTDVVANIEIELPSLVDQKKIASILKALDDKIALNNQVNNNLLEQIISLSSERLEHDVAPEGWSEITLCDIATFVGGYSYKSSELVESTTAMATIKNFDRNGGFKLDGFKQLQPSSKIKPSQYAELFDVLVAHTDLTQNAEVVGNAELLMNKSNYAKIAFSMDLVKVSPTTDGISNFLLAAM